MIAPLRLPGLGVSVAYREAGKRLPLVLVHGNSATRSAEAARGGTIQQAIAADLGCAAGTIEVHVSALFERARVANRSS